MSGSDFCFFAHWLGFYIFGQIFFCENPCAENVWFTAHTAVLKFVCSFRAERFVRLMYVLWFTQTCRFSGPNKASDLVLRNPLGWLDKNVVSQIC